MAQNEDEICISIDDLIDEMRIICENAGDNSSNNSSNNRGLI